MDAAEIADTPFTLPDIPPPLSAPSISEQKRGDPVALMTASRTHGPRAYLPAFPLRPPARSRVLLYPSTTTTTIPTITREDAMAAFLKDPLISPEQMVLEHIRAVQNGFFRTVQYNGKWGM